MGRRTHFSDVGRRNIGSQADSQASDNPPNNERRKGKCPPCENGGNRKEYCRNKQNWFASVTVSKDTRNKGARKAPDEGAAIGPSHGCGTIEMKIYFKEL